MTKSTLILRDDALLAAACERTDVEVNFSIGTLDRDVWQLTEPGTPPPDRRVEALRRLTALGIPCGVLVAPVLPGLSDSEAQLREVVEACADAGALSISGVALHLRGPLRTHYFDWLERRPAPTWSGSTGRASRRARTKTTRQRGRVETTVRAAALRCGVTGRDRYRGSRRTEAAADESVTAARANAVPGDAAKEEGQQLRLL